jgi:hypothetical protein
VSFDRFFFLSFFFLFRLAWAAVLMIGVVAFFGCDG